LVFCLFLNYHFKDTNAEIIKNETSTKNKSIQRKELYIEPIEIKNDLINNTALCFKHKKSINIGKKYYLQITKMLPI